VIQKRVLLILNIDFSFITDFGFKRISQPSVIKMSEELKRIKREVANLKKRAEELKLLKSDIDNLKKLHEKLVEGGFD